MSVVCVRRLKSAITTTTTTTTTTRTSASIEGIIVSKKRLISSIGFSGAGFLIAYHLGVASCFNDQQLLHLSQPPKNNNNNKSSSFQQNTNNEIKPNHPNDTNLRHHHKQNQNRLVRLTGVSAGSIVAASLLAQVNPATDGMNAVLQISHMTRERARSFDALQPGFSLIDVVESVLKPLLYNATKEDPESFLQHINTHGLLRVGLTDRRIFPPIGYNPNAFVYVDRFRCLDDIVAACILSSYIPGVTGPAWGNRARKNQAVTRAAQQLDEMIRDGCVKKGTTGETISPTALSSPQSQPSSSLQNEDSHLNQTLRGSGNSTAAANTVREICWDGGLVNAFPTFDANTIIVSPIAADFRYNASISPAIEYREATNGSMNHHNNNNNSPQSPPPSSRVGANRIMGKVVLNPVVRVYVTAANVANIKGMIISSDDEVLQNKFHQGYDNAKQYCIQNSLINVHHHFISKL